MVFKAALGLQESARRARSPGDAWPGTVQSYCYTSREALRYTHRMVPVNVKLDDHRVAQLDAGILIGRAANRSDAIRIAVDQLLRDWHRAAWDDAWERATATSAVDENDEFADWAEEVQSSWADLDQDA